jgi:hypothetical protein
MGLFAFRRLRDREAASNEVASLSIAEPAPTLEPQEPPTDGNNNRRNGGRRKRQLLPDAG